MRLPRGILVHGRGSGVLLAFGLALASAEASKRFELHRAGEEPPGSERRSNPPHTAGEARPPDEAVESVPLDATTLERLAGIADAYRERALAFTCRETRRRVKYDAAGRPRSERTRRADYLLAAREGAPELVELRRRSDSTRSAWKVVRSELPSAYEWLLLFEPRRQQFFTYTDLGPTDHGGFPGRRIGFRGLLDFGQGSDLRGWQGEVVLDARTNATLEVSAEPIRQSERLAEQYDRWERSLRLSIGLFTSPDPLAPPGEMPRFGGKTFRTARRPVGRRYLGSYSRQDHDLTLPTRIRYESVLAVARDEVRTISAEVRVYDDYRFFRTGSTDERLRLPSLD